MADTQKLLKGAESKIPTQRGQSHKSATPASGTYSKKALLSNIDSMFGEDEKIVFRDIKPVRPTLPRGRWRRIEYYAKAPFRQARTMWLATSIAMKANRWVVVSRVPASRKSDPPPYTEMPQTRGTEPECHEKEHALKDQSSETSSFDGSDGPHKPVSPRSFV